MIEEKICCSCKKGLTLNNFHKCRSHKDGLASICKECDKVKVQKWITENPEKRNKIRRKNYLENKERYNQISADWSKVNRDKCNEANKRWKNKDPENAKAVRVRYGNKRRVWKENTESRVTTKQINELIKNSNNICFWCDQEIPNNKMHIDHIYPLSKGGKDEINNLVVSCESCNKHKANKDPEIWLEELECQKN